MNSPNFSVFQVLLNAARLLIIRPVQLVLGEFAWRPPAWLDLVVSLISGLIGRLGNFRRSHPKAFWQRSLTALILVGVVAVGVKWYQNRPRPMLVTISATLPKPTKLEKDAKFDPLTLKFSQAAARIEQVGKVVSSGLTVVPAISGEWRWNSDAELQFNPTQDWPVGLEYRIDFAPDFLAAQVRLADNSFAFSSPKFLGRVESVQFYEDPIDPKIKKVVANLSFSHPVDKTDFERHASFKLRIEPIKDFGGRGIVPVPFKVQYDETAGKAYVHSDLVTIPAQPGEMLFTLEKGTRSSRSGPGIEVDLQGRVSIPGIDDYFKIAQVAGSEVTNTQQEAERVVTIETTALANLKEVSQNVKVYLLPKDKARDGSEQKIVKYNWSDPLEVTDRVLAESTELSVEWIPAERDFSQLHSFKFKADTGRYVLVKIKRGVKSFGGFELSKDFTAIVFAREFPQLVKILSEGSVLSLTGEKKISILARNLKSVQLEISRLLPGAINHLLTQTWGAFGSPSFETEDFGFDNLSEVFSETRSLPQGDAGKNQYTALDLASFMSKSMPPQGLFLVRIFGFDPVTKERLDAVQDERLVIVTDLGILVKQSAKGLQDIFVSSIKDGGPAAGVQVEVWGKNGLPITFAKTDPSGHATFPPLKDFKREKTPVAYVARLGEDLSFLPIGKEDRDLNFSRFDTGGLYASHALEGLQAYLFSDRGIYRPGDKINVGLILKDQSWQNLPKNLPLELAISDPRGVEVKTQNISFSGVGFEEVSYQTRAESPSGTYYFTLYLLKDDSRRGILGSTYARVEEFMPDRMTIKSKLSSDRSGWIDPTDLTALVSLNNLFGTPAQERTIKGRITLSPAVPFFDGYKDYFFYDSFTPKRTNSYDQDLGSLASDKDGLVSFELQLNKYEPAPYRLRFIAEGFELDGGRSVVAESQALISPSKYLIGFKPDGNLRYLHKGSNHVVNLIAIDPNLKKIEAKDLKIELVESRYVSILNKQPNGTLAYQSVKKEIVKAESRLDLAAVGNDYPLVTTDPGSFALVIRDRQDRELARVTYEVTGDGNANRTLDKNAELQLKLNSREFSPGEEAEIEIQAPYTGAGIITVESDKLYNFKWFSTQTTSTVQKILIPPELEGNGYLTVTFVRGIDSPELYMSPLSYGSVPFSVSRSRHTQKVKLDMPTSVKPGDTLSVDYFVDGPGRVAIFGADEGILQFARYKTPDPLGHFFRKRALEVKTSQILDLILPEYKLVQALSAPGGDEDGGLARNLNPFKRKGEAPVVFWSGLIDSSGGPGKFQYRVPDYFNGTIRVIAVSVADAKIGVVEQKVVAQGDFVIQPQAPYFVTPGDEFEVSTLVANNIKDSGANFDVVVSLAAGDSLQVLGDRQQRLKIGQGKDASVHFRLKALSKLGSTDLKFKVESAPESVRTGSSSYSTSLSVRPITIKSANIQTGYFTPGMLGGKKRQVKLNRTLFPEERKVEGTISASPLLLVRSLSRYLTNFPHGCTEQVLSQLTPGLVLDSVPELTAGIDRDKLFSRAISVLENRQNSAGGFGLWQADSNSSDYITIYATQLLLDARERGLEVPPELTENALEYLSGLIATPAHELTELRAQSYALYVLARSGRVVTHELGEIRAYADSYLGSKFRTDIGAMFLAATYKQLHLDKEATDLQRGVALVAQFEPDYESYYDSMAHSATYLYLASRHFPELAAKISLDQVLSLADRAAKSEYNTFSAAQTILGLDAYSRFLVADASVSTLEISEVDSKGESRRSTLAGSVLRSTNVSTQASSLELSGDGKLTFYEVIEDGYDREPPQNPIRNGLEVFKELRNEKGEVITQIGLADKVYVALTLRAIAGAAGSVALTDLLPGGFELDLNAKDGTAGLAPSGIARWQPYHVDFREDRVNLYGYVGPEASIFSYRLKPINPGKFRVPPVVAEDMYDRAKAASSAAGEFVINR